MSFEIDPEAGIRIHHVTGKLDFDVLSSALRAIYDSDRFDPDQSSL